MQRGWNARLLALKNIIMFFSVLLFLFSCSEKQSKWQGSIKEVEGITIVKNFGVPIYGENVFSLVEQITLGVPEGNENYMFNRIAFDVDDEGRIYVLDSQLVNIKVYDNNGGFLFSFGNKGQGPGEIQFPNRFDFHITPQDEIFVHDSTRRILFYSLNGEFLKQTLTPAHIGGADVRTHSSGRYIKCKAGP